MHITITPNNGPRAGIPFSYRATSFEDACTWAHKKSNELSGNRYTCQNQSIGWLIGSGHTIVVTLL